MEPISPEVSRHAEIMARRKRTCPRSRADCEVRCVAYCRFSKAARLERSQRKLVRKRVEPRSGKLTVAEIERANNQNHRRAIRYGVPHTATLEEVLELYSGEVKCRYCEAPESQTLIIVDHFFPLIKGGGHVQGNLVLACVMCNWRKKDKLPEVFLAEIGKSILLLT